MYPDTTLFVISLGDLYLLGILNSKAIWFYLKHSCSVLGDPNNGGRLRLKRIFVKMLPVPANVDKAHYDRMISLVSLMLDYNKRLQRQRQLKRWQSWSVELR
jgi:hypothetical protein